MNNFKLKVLEKNGQYYLPTGELLPVENRDQAIKFFASSSQTPLICNAEGRPFKKISIYSINGYPVYRDAEGLHNIHTDDRDIESIVKIVTDLERSKGFEPEIVLND